MYTKYTAYTICTVPMLMYKALNVNIRCHGGRIVSVTSLPGPGMGKIEHINAVGAGGPLRTHMVYMLG